MGLSKVNTSYYLSQSYYMGRNRALFLQMVKISMFESTIVNSSARLLQIEFTLM